MNAIAEPVLKPLDVDMPMRTNMVVCIYEAMTSGDAACVMGDPDPTGIRIAQARLIEALAALEVHASEGRMPSRRQEMAVPCGVA